MKNLQSSSTPSHPKHKSTGICLHKWNSFLSASTRSIKAFSEGFTQLSALLDFIKGWKLISQENMQMACNLVDDWIRLKVGWGIFHVRSVCWAYVLHKIIKYYRSGQLNLRIDERKARLIKMNVSLYRENGNFMKMGCEWQPRRTMHFEWAVLPWKLWRGKLTRIGC